MSRFAAFILLSAVLSAAPIRSLAAPPDGKSQQSTADRSTKVNIKTEPFGKTPSGEQVMLITCTNANGLTVKLTNYGARLVSLLAPDRNGKLANVTLGFDTLDGYVNHEAYFGTTTGRYANRIAGGKFTLDGKQYQLAVNNGPNHLHGGLVGFDRKVWKVTPAEGGVTFSYRSPDGEEGYPGNLDVQVNYQLTDDNQLQISYTAHTDKTTILNLTNHAYWNLAGVGSGDVLGHRMMLAADQYLPTDMGSIPTGQPADVRGTPMDFTKPQTVGSRIAELKKDPDGTRGYDHCYKLRSQDGSLALAARVEDPKSGRVMEVSTTEPGVQFYTGNFLDGTTKSGGFTQHAALCLEAQHFPDSPNKPQFPSVVLKPGQTYRQVTVHQFLVD